MNLDSNNLDSKSAGRHDPNLDAATEAIKAILKQYDVAGAVVLVSPTHVDWCVSPSPSWSLWETHPDSLRLRMSSCNPNNAAQMQQITDSATVACGIHKGCQAVGEIAEQMLKRLSDKFEINFLSRRV